MPEKKGPVERLSRLPLAEALVNYSPELLKFNHLREILQDNKRTDEERVKAIARELQLNLNRKRRCEHWRFHSRRGSRCSCPWHRTIAIIWTVLREEENRRYGQRQREYTSESTSPGLIPTAAASGQDSSPTKVFRPPSTGVATANRRKCGHREHGIKIRPDESLLALGFDDELKS